TTERLVFGTGVTNASTRHLSVLASTWSTLAELSGGRVILGIGTGDSSLRTMGLHPLKLAELERYVADLRTLFAGGEVIEPTSGASFRLAWSEPRDIPIYIAASAPKIMKLAGRIADGVVMLVGTDPRFVQAGLDLVAEGAAEAGRTLDDIHVTLWTPTAIGSDEALAADLVRAHVARILIRPLPAELDDETMRQIEQIARSYDYYKHMSTSAGHAELVPDSLIRHFALAGTPATCAEQYQALRELAIDEIAIIPYVPEGGDRLSVMQHFADFAHG
ncbi:MAG: LLM class flavin-dependent oxidoreductase, partial [Acidimicrobiia bacterium]